MSSPKVLFGFHAVGVRLKTAPQSIIEIYFEPTRRDARMRQFLEKAKEAGARLIEADGLRLAKLAGSHGHQGVAARVEAIEQIHSLDDLLDSADINGNSARLRDNERYSDVDRLRRRLGCAIDSALVQEGGRRDLGGHGAFASGRHERDVRLHCDFRRRHVLLCDAFYRRRWQH